MKKSRPKLGLRSGIVCLILPVIEFYFYKINTESLFILKLLWALFSLIFFWLGYFTIKSPIKYLLITRSILSSGKELWSETYSKRNLGINVSPDVYKSVGAGITPAELILPVLFIVLGIVLFFLCLTTYPALLSYSIISTVLGYKLLSDRIKRLY